MAVSITYASMLLVRWSEAMLVDQRVFTLAALWLLVLLSGCQKPDTSSPPTPTGSSGTITISPSTSVTTPPTSATTPATNNLTNGLVLYMPFSGNANDASGNGNTGSVTGATLTADRTGNPNRAYAFVRANQQYITVPHSAGLDITGTGLTLCAWIYPTWNGSSTNMQIMSKAQDSSNEGRKFGLGTGGPTLVNFELRTNTGTVDQDWNCTACSFQQNVWQFIAVTYDGTRMRWYRNGTLVYQIPKSGSIVSSRTALTIGSFSDKAQSYFNGSMDEIRIYNRALTDSELLSLSQL